MACYAKNVIATALSEVGYKETGTNHNKFAAYIDKNYPDFYNFPKQNVSWCDLFVDYCVLVNSASESEALSVLCQPKKSAGAGCSFSYDYYKAKGRTGKEPKIGAQIFFGTGKKPTHTGIVVDFNADSVYTVEGNSDDQVKKHTYKRTSSKIFGYGYPRYTEAQSTTPVTPAPSTPAPEPVVAPSKPAAEAKTTTYWVVSVKTSLNVRSGPGTKYSIVSTLDNKDIVTVYEQKNGWGRIGTAKWVSMTYLKPHTVTTAKTGKQYTVKVNTSLNVRTGPGKNYNVVKSIKNGTKVTVYEVKDGWGRIGNNQWCSMTYLK